MKDRPVSHFAIQFWGVRGSIPAPGKETLRYGGNTSCVAMRIANQLLIFDGGTGLRQLGKSLLKDVPVNAYMFFTHSHWDRIQGFPFFAPAFVEGNCFQIYGASASTGASMKQRLGDQMLHQNFPFPMKTMQAELSFHNLAPGEIVQVEDVSIETSYLNQSDRAIGYRISWHGKTAVYATDADCSPHLINKNLLYLAKEADLLIYDSAYFNKTYQFQPSDWDSSTWRSGIEVAKEAGVKRLVLSHHDPDHSDDFLDHIETKIREDFPDGLLAREGMTVYLG